MVGLAYETLVREADRCHLTLPSCISLQDNRKKSLSVHPVCDIRLHFRNVFCSSRITHRIQRMYVQHCFGLEIAVLIVSDTSEILPVLLSVGVFVHFRLQWSNGLP
jgi:hypothetical protein